MTAKAERICVIAGAGPGNGAAFARRFTAAGYRCVLLARTIGAIARIASELPGAVAIACDTREEQSVADAFGRIRRELGHPSVLIYNAYSRHFAPLDGTDAEMFASAWKTGAFGAFLCVKQAVADLRARGGGNIVLVGATASLRGGVDSLAFSAAKGALRNMAQSLARGLGPENIHVSHVVIDGVVDSPRSREAEPDRPDELFLAPDAIADAVWRLTEQDRTAWTFELDLRPAKERW